MIIMYRSGITDIHSLLGAVRLVKVSSNSTTLHPQFHAREAAATSLRKTGRVTLQTYRRQLGRIVTRCVPGGGHSLGAQS